MREKNEGSRITIGLDLGDRRHRFCVLGGKGEGVEEGTLSNKREWLSELSRRYRGALVVMEAGCHSPWISRHLEGAGCKVVVSNPRKTRAIYQHERKSDRRDALMLARIARMGAGLALSSAARKRRGAARSLAHQVTRQSGTGTSGSD